MSKLNINYFMSNLALFFLISEFIRTTPEKNLPVYGEEGLDEEATKVSKQCFNDFADMFPTELRHAPEYVREFLQDNRLIVKTEDSYELTSAGRAVSTTMLNPRRGNGNVSFEKLFSNKGVAYLAKAAETAITALQDKLKDSALYKETQTYSNVLTVESIAENLIDTARDNNKVTTVVGENVSDEEE